MSNTDAQRAANRRYQSKHRYIQVRLDPDMAARVQARAEAAGETLQAMMIRLLMQELEQDK